MANNNEPLLTDRETFTVEIQPTGRRVCVKQGNSLLKAAQQAGVELVAACNGAGFCGTCRVRLIEGKLTPPSEHEADLLGSLLLEQGYRLACCAEPLSGVQIEIPRTSMAVGQRLQVEGAEYFITPTPRVTGLDLVLSPPELTDLRADLERVNQVLAVRGWKHIQGGLKSLSQLSDQLRKNNWILSLAVEKGEKNTRLVSVFPQKTQLLGLAGDLGTTKIALYLVDLESGATLASLGIMNPQISFGEDVVSRIAFANEDKNNRLLLQTRLIDIINEGILTLCDQAEVAPNQIVDAVFVGNTAIHHLFCGLPVRQLGSSPYVPAVSEEVEFFASEVGLNLPIDAKVYMPAIIAGFVGADHTAALLSTSIRNNGEPRVLIDIGTNTEISLAIGEKLYTCSTASGPAFEGAHIRDGMRAAPGAIERVIIDENIVTLKTVGGQLPVGICGTGILSAIAELLKNGILNRLGNLDQTHPCVRTHNGQTAFVLANASETEHGQDILITRRDINEIQLAKGAIRTGIDVLLEVADLDANAVEAWIIAGAFGTFLDISSAVQIKMFPDLPLDRYFQVGNAAGVGAKQLLISTAKRHEATQLIEDVDYIELTIYPGFKDKFVKSLYY
jgi:uncharacterized 2Fe-2S/4Fe-4S cluster protein (DUF4445 family)